MHGSAVSSPLLSSSLLLPQGRQVFPKFKAQVTDSGCVPCYSQDFLCYDPGYSTSFLISTKSFGLDFDIASLYDFQDPIRLPYLLVNTSPGIAITSPASLMVINQTLKSLAQ